MKLALNGALTIGTDDGANIEIRQQVGDDNIFIFGLKTPEVAALRASGLPADALYEGIPQLRAVLTRSPPGLSRPRSRGATAAGRQRCCGGGDHYLLLADHASYAETQARRRAVRGRRMGPGRAIANVAGMGAFSSDRTIRDYAAKIWGMTPAPGLTAPAAPVAIGL